MDNTQIPEIHGDIIYKAYRLGGKYQRFVGSWSRQISFITNWFGHEKSMGGQAGCYHSISDLKRSVSSNGLGKKNYEIWKFHVGKLDSEIPWFPPEKVYDPRDV